MPEVRVEWLFPDGAGGAPAPKGGVVRLVGAFPGDRVRYREQSRRGTTIVGLVEAVLEPSADRREPTCPWASACGGCDLAGLQAGPRRQALANIAQRAFGLPSPPEMVTGEGSGRARIKLAIEDGRIGYREAGSHALVEVERCAIARPEVQVAHERLRAWAQGGSGRLDGLASVELRSDGERVVYAFAAGGSVPGAVREGLAALGDVAIDGRAVHGDPVLWLRVAGLPLRASPLSFYQVDLALNERMVAHVRDAVIGLRAERVLDLYAGNGNLSLPIAAAGVPVVAVEREGQSIRDLQASAQAAGLDVQTVEADVERFDPSRQAFDVVVLDPPRAGAPGVVERLVRNRPRAIVYVSCHAPSGGKDLRAAKGYRITSARCFDLFPDTRHFETIVVAER